VDDPPRRRARPRARPRIQRLALAAVTLALAVLLGGMAFAAWAVGLTFFAAMAGIGCLMTLWVGALTVLRGERR
jgi:hypothetical protein